MWSGPRAAGASRAASSSSGRLLAVQVLGVQVKVSRIELARCLQPVPVQNRQEPAPQGDQVAAPQLLKHAVDMHRREPKRVPKLRLRDGHLASVSVRKAHRPELHHHLAQELGDPAVSLAPADPDHPRPEYGRIDQRVAPEGVADAWKAPDEIANVLMADEPDLAWRDRAQAVVQGRKVQALQVGDVARDVKGHDLALAGQGHLVAADKALKDEAAPGRAIALTHDVLVGPDGLNLHGQVEEGLPLLGREVGDAFQLADKRVLVGWRGHNGSYSCGGSTRLSRSPARQRSKANDAGSF